MVSSSTPRGGAGASMSNDRASRLRTASFQRQTEHHEAHSISSDEDDDDDDSDSDLNEIEDEDDHPEQAREREQDPATLLFNDFFDFPSSDEEDDPDFLPVVPVAASSPPLNSQPPTPAGGGGRGRETTDGTMDWWTAIFGNSYSNLESGNGTDDDEESDGDYVDEDPNEGGKQGEGNSTEEEESEEEIALMEGGKMTEEEFRTELSLLTREVELYYQSQQAQTQSVDRERGDVMSSPAWQRDDPRATEGVSSGKRPEVTDVHAIRKRTRNPTGSTARRTTNESAETARIQPQSSNPSPSLQKASPASAYSPSTSREILSQTHPLKRRKTDSEPQVDGKDLPIPPPRYHPQAHTNTSPQLALLHPATSSFEPPKDGRPETRPAPGPEPVIDPEHVRPPRSIYTPAEAKERRKQQERERQARLRQAKKAEKELTEQKVKQLEALVEEWKDRAERAEKRVGELEASLERHASEQRKRKSVRRREEAGEDLSTEESEAEIGEADDHHDDDSSEDDLEMDDLAQEAQDLRQGSDGTRIQQAPTPQMNLNLSNLGQDSLNQLLAIVHQAAQKQGIRLEGDDGVTTTSASR